MLESFKKSDLHLFFELIWLCLFIYSFFFLFKKVAFRAPTGLKEGHK